MAAFAAWCVRASHRQRPENSAFHLVLGTMNGDGNSTGQGGDPRGGTLRVEGTNVVRVPFGVRRARRARPARPEHWATLVLPFQAGGGGPTPPWAA
jgi:hypothetical protein